MVILFFISNGINGGGGNVSHIVYIVIQTSCISYLGILSRAQDIHYKSTKTEITKKKSPEALAVTSGFLASLPV